MIQKSPGPLRKTELESEDLTFIPSSYLLLGLDKS